MSRIERLVEGLVPTPEAAIDLREEAWAFALDQRAFGPRRLVVAFAARDGMLSGLAYTNRTQPPELALEACIQHLGRGAAAAIAFSDEPVSDGPPPASLMSRFAAARKVASAHGVHLVDWMLCDDLMLRSCNSHSQSTANGGTFLDLQRPRSELALARAVALAKMGAQRRAESQRHGVIDRWRAAVSLR